MKAYQAQCPHRCGGMIECTPSLAYEISGDKRHYFVCPNCSESVFATYRSGTWKIYRNDHVAMVATMGFGSTDSEPLPIKWESGSGNQPPPPPPVPDVESYPIRRDQTLVAKMLEEQQKAAAMMLSAHVVSPINRTDSDSTRTPSNRFALSIRQVASATVGGLSIAAMPFLSPDAAATVVLSIAAVTTAGLISGIFSPTPETREAA